MISIRWVMTLLLFTALSFTDIRERRVPRWGQLLLLAWAAGDAIGIPGGPDVREAFLGIILAGFTGYAVYAAGKMYGRWRAVQAEVFGLGDVRVLAISGALVGIQQVGPMLWRSVLIGGLWAVTALMIRLLRRQPIHRELTIPYVPTIALAVCSLIFEWG